MTAAAAVPPLRLWSVPADSVAPCHRGMTWSNSERDRSKTADPVDVVVVGGGPAGAAAAITLARAGRDVRAVDKATFPRDKCCGDGLTTGALRLLEALGLDPATVPSWQRVDDVVVRSPSGRDVRRSRSPRRRACSRPWPAGPISTPPCSTWPAPRASRCTTATR